MNQKEILAQLKASLGCPDIRFPQSIQFDVQGGTLTIGLAAAAAGLSKKPYNMQEDPAAFEGWALALYAHLLRNQGTVVLSLKDDPKPASGSQNHFHRFLYRAMKFSGQFPWFQLSPPLCDAIKTFQADLQSAKFVNNKGKGAAGINGNLENAVEAYFADQHPELLKKITEDAGFSVGDCFYRQLPVGLFREKNKKENRFFSGAKSAVDLWSCQDDTITIYELKARKTKIGMVSELFFYAQYIYDMFCDDTASFHPLLPSRKVKNDRGYSHLISLDGEKIYKKVQACLLYADSHDHPLVTEQVIALLNQGTGHIQYKILPYPPEILRDCAKA